MNIEIKVAVKNYRLRIGLHSEFLWDTGMGDFGFVYVESYYRRYV